MTGGPLGPFGTEAEARGSLVHLLAGATLSEQVSIPDRNHRVLGQALAAAGVELGAYDERILGWLAGFEPATVAVVAGLIGRAYQAGLRAAPDEQAEAGAAVEVLRSAADALTVNLATWEARDRADPSPEARRAHRSAIAAADAVTNTMSRLRDRLAGGSRDRLQ
jgi:hypothetical protein